MKNKGITVIALIVTIIILLILAGITMTTLTGNNGILNQAKKAVDEHTKAAMKEELQLKIAELKIEYETDQGLKENDLTLGKYIKDKLSTYELSNGSKIQYEEKEDKFSFNQEGNEITFNINESGDITDFIFSGAVLEENQKDTVGPVVNIISSTTNSITFYATDNIGIVAYAITETNEQPEEWETIKVTKELEKDITGLVNNKTYYIWTKDEAGNISEIQTAKTIDFESLEYTISWSGTTATIKVVESNLGVRYRIDTAEDWNSYSNPISVESGITVQFILTDGTNASTATSVTPRLSGLQLNYDANTGTGEVPESKEYTHEDKITVSFTDVPTKTGYIFNGWSTNPKASSAEYTENGTKTFKMPINNVTLYAIWLPDTGISYKVIHRQMNVTGNDYTIYETENLTGTTGVSITPPVRSYTGFTAPTTKTTTIAGDGSTTVTYDYIRNQYTFTLGSGTGVSTTGSSPSGKYYYGATITLKATVSTEHTWDKWVGSDSSFSTIAANTTINMPANNLTMTPFIESKKSEVEKAKDEETIFNTKTELKDEYGNTVVIPEGFKIAEDSAIEVTGGVVIEDVNHGETRGSQFVWIPVSKQTEEGGQKIKGANKEIEITLGRYQFTEEGSPTALSWSYNYLFKEENALDSTNLLNYGNTIAKDIEAFKSSVNNNGGYYIGRYESRTKSKRYSGSDEINQVTVEADDFVYNYITQPQAAKLGQEMYKDKSFTSDLINSYAWDTAIVFLQEFGKENYSNQSNAGLESKGTNHLTDITKQDKVCNVWDMANNYGEWSTETARESDPCVLRGGSRSEAQRRAFTTIDSKNEDVSWRVVLYL